MAKLVDAADLKSAAPHTGVPVRFRFRAPVTSTSSCFVTLVVARLRPYGLWVIAWRILALCRAAWAMALNAWSSTAKAGLICRYHPTGESCLNGQSAQTSAGEAPSSDCMGSVCVATEFVHNASRFCQLKHALVRQVNPLRCGLASMCHDTWKMERLRCLWLRAERQLYSA